MRKTVVILSIPDILVTWRRFDKNLGFKSPLPHLFSRLIPIEEGLEFSPGKELMNLAVAEIKFIQTVQFERTESKKLPK